MINIDRLRKESTNGGKKLLNSLTQKRHFFNEEISKLENSGEVLIASNEDAEKYHQIQIKLAIECCNKISPSFAIPILIQLFNECMRKDLQGNIAFLSFYIKRAIEFIAKNAFEEDEGSLASIKAIEQAIRSCGLLVNLETLKLLFELYGESGDYFKITSSGTSSSPNLEALEKNFSIVPPSSKVSFRTLNDTVKWLRDKPIESSKAIARIIQGASASEQGEFQGTILEKVGNGTSPEFWVGLWVRLQLLLYAIKKHVIQEKNDPFEIIIFDKFEINALEKFPQPLLDLEIGGIFWEKEWYKKNQILAPCNLLTDRPAIIIDNNSGVFVTLIPIIADSIAWYMEASVLGYWEDFKRNLPKCIFKNEISKPFEDSVIEIFRKAGFLAGNVNDKGVWDSGNGLVKLINEKGEKIPGEIDVLAKSDQMKLLVLAECKILHHPYNSKGLRNLFCKLGPDDGESFYCKLEKKVSWVLQSKPFNSCSDYELGIFLVVDIHARKGIPGKFQVVEINMLPDFLTHFKESMMKC